MFSAAKLEMPVLNVKEHRQKQSYFVLVVYIEKMFHK